MTLNKYLLDGQKKKLELDVYEFSGGQIMVCDYNKGISISGKQPTKLASGCIHRIIIIVVVSTMSHLETLMLTDN